LNTDALYPSRSELRGITFKNKYRLYLTDQGFRPTSITTYTDCIRQYLKSELSPADFRMKLFDRRLSRSTINNFGFAINHYHRMVGGDTVSKVAWPHLKLDNQLPYYFESEDVGRIFGVCGNIKHLAMLKTLFFGCLRSSELCNLDDSDLDLDNLHIRVRAGKGGNDGIVPISEDCTRTLKTYLSIRPMLKIDNQQPVFYTDHGNRFNRVQVSRVFHLYKDRAGIIRRGGVHCFSRHTPATLMIRNGCSLNVVQEILRHKDIRSTLRYAHVSDATKRENYIKYLTL
jgi:integrase/recombinase XerD